MYGPVAASGSGYRAATVRATSASRAVDPVRVAVRHDDHVEPVGAGGVDLRVERHEVAVPGFAGSSSAAGVGWSAGQSAQKRISD